jgi:hypothetical protein
MALALFPNCSLVDELESILTKKKNCNTVIKVCMYVTEGQCNGGYLLQLHKQHFEGTYNPNGAQLAENKKLTYNFK